MRKKQCRDGPAPLREQDRSPAESERERRDHGGQRLTAFAWPDPDAVTAQADVPVGAPLKVLHVITKLWAGAGGNTLLTALGTDRERFEPWIAGCPGGPLWDGAQRGGVQTVVLEHFRETVAPVADLRTLLQLMRLIRRERFAVVHTHSSKGGVLGRIAAKACGVPVIVHTFHGFSFHDDMSRLRRMAYIAVERSVRPLTDMFLAVAPRVASEAVDRRIATASTTHVVPSAIDLAAVGTTPDGSVRAELGLSDEQLLIGTVGRLAAQKAPLDFVRAAAIVHARNRRTTFVMVGDGPLRARVEAQAACLGVPVTVLGERHDAPRLAGAMDVFVVASHYEGLGRALTEAMAAGRPVVATAVNGIPDLVIPHQTGLLVPPGSPSKLAAAILWMLEHPQSAARMGHTGSQRARRLFTPDLMCRLTASVYHHALQATGTCPR